MGARYYTYLATMGLAMQAAKRNGLSFLVLDRPNPIGLHRVTVISCDPPTSVHVEALEAIDGTPILDLKIAMKVAPDA